jgi:hypothetical protein
MFYDDPDGAKRWYDKSGYLHREDGPAMEYLDGSKFWYYHGEFLNCSSQEEFERLLKVKAFW